MDARAVLKYGGLAIGGLVGLVVFGFLLGVFGVPAVTDVSNEFGAVNDSTTEIETTIGIDNPNPIGVSLGGVTIDYAVDMNDVKVATGTKEGLSIGAGNTSVDLVTYLNNSQIPPWWYTHIRNGENSTVLVDATVEAGLFGTHELTRTKNISTNILGAFNSTETRPVDADSQVVSDPVLYLNRTAATYGEELTRQQTPLNMDFTVFNPKLYPYTVTTVGYTISMNNITVGSGETDRSRVIPPQATETLTARTVIDNRRLDEWWVSHIENDQVTDLYIDVYVVVEPDIAGREVSGFRIDSTQLDYRETIRTDIFGTKNQSDGGTDEGTDSTTDETPGTDSTPSDGSETPADDSDSTPEDAGTATPEGDTQTATPEDTGTATPEDDDTLLAVR